MTTCVSEQSGHVAESLLQHTPRVRHHMSTASAAHQWNESATIQHELSIKHSTEMSVTNQHDHANTQQHVTGVKNCRHLSIMKSILHYVLLHRRCSLVAVYVAGSQTCTQVGESTAMQRWNSLQGGKFVIPILLQGQQMTENGLCFSQKVVKIHHNFA